MCPNSGCGGCWPLVIPRELLHPVDWLAGQAGGHVVVQPHEEEVGAEAGEGGEQGGGGRLQVRRGGGQGGGQGGQGLG